MAITQTLLDSGQNTTAQSSYTTASKSPGANKLQLLGILGRRTSTPAISSVTGCSLTWTEVASKPFSAGGNRVDTIFLYKAIGSSPSTGAVTIDFGETQNTCSWIWIEVDGVDATTPVVQNASNSADAATGLTVTLATFGSANNATFGFFGIAETPLGAITQGTGFTKIGQTPTSGTGNSAHSIEAQWRSDNDTTVDASVASATDWGGIAVEIKAATGSGANLPVVSISLSPQLYSRKRGLPIVAMQLDAGGRLSVMHTMPVVTMSLDPQALTPGAQGAYRTMPVVTMQLTPQVFGKKRVMGVVQMALTPAGLLPSGGGGGPQQPFGVRRGRGHAWGWHRWFN